MPTDTKQEPKTDNKPVIIKRVVEHKFTDAEQAKLSKELVTALTRARVAEDELAAIKKTYSAKVDEAKARVGSLASVLEAGFEPREKECRVEFIPAEKRKKIFLVETGALLVTEDMLPADFEQDLIQAESNFERREEIVLWEAGLDKGVLVVGRIAGKWFSALRLRIAKTKLDERLDSEQKSVKKRWDAVQTAAKRALEWVKANVKEFEGFKPLIEKAVEPHKEREE